MVRGSPRHHLTCHACAAICERCAEDCERVREYGGVVTNNSLSVRSLVTACQVGPQDKMMLDCAKACRECAAMCREMAKDATGALAAEYTDQLRSSGCG